MPSELEFLAATLSGLKSTLERLPASDKKEMVTMSLADQFNGMVSRVSAAYPSLIDHLPRPINATTPLRKIGKADASYVELEAYCEQITNLLRLVT